MMRFMIEIFEQMTEENPTEGLWASYPFEVNENETWIRREDLTIGQRDEIVISIRFSAERQEREARLLLRLAAERSQTEKWPDGMR